MAVAPGAENTTAGASLRQRATERAPKVAAREASGATAQPSRGPRRAPIRQWLSAPKEGSVVGEDTRYGRLVVAMAMSRPSAAAMMSERAHERRPRARACRPECLSPLLPVVR